MPWYWLTHWHCDRSNLSLVGYSSVQLGDPQCPESLWAPNSVKTEQNYHQLGQEEKQRARTRPGWPGRFFYWNFVKTPPLLQPNNEVLSIFLNIATASHFYKLNWARPSALTYNVFIKSFLWSYKLHTILGRRGDLHPIILTFGNRHTILCALKNRGHLKCCGIILSNLKCKNKVSNIRHQISG